MASVQFDKKTGRALIQFAGPDGKRHKLRLGKISQRNAERFNEKLELLITSAKHGQPLDNELTAWTQRLSDDVAAKLTAYGLLSRRESLSLGKLIDDFLLRSDVKPQTITTLRQTQRNLMTFFGYDRSLRDITPGDADEFRSHLLRPKPPKINGKRTGEGGEGLSEATARRRCSAAKQFFRVAVRKLLITANPFADITGGAKSNKARMRFISREDAAKVLEACPDAEWRLIFALSRFGGLRTPSEHYGLRWADVDLPAGRFLVHSPKTEHHTGGESRWVPIFPELRPHLEAAYDRAPTIDTTATPAEKEAASYVIQRYRNQANLRTRFFKIIKRAGLTPWPKVFQNLRSSRQTELAAQFPLHIVCAWLGNKAAVAAEHYLQVTDADFARASTEAGSAGANLAHSGSTSVYLGGSDQPEETSKTPRRAMLVDAGCSSENQQGRPGGIRHISESTALGSDSQKRGAKSGAIGGGATNSLTSRKQTGDAGGAADPATLATVDDLPADLALVVAAWPKLSADTRAEILAAIDRQAAAD